MAEDAQLRKNPAGFQPQRGKYWQQDVLILHNSTIEK